jgi:hypothetical protein
MTQTIRIRPKIYIASGHRKSWIKHVTACDKTKTNGYAFDGKFLPAGVEVDLPVGAVLVRVDPEGSVKNSYQSGHVLQLRPDGELELLASGNWRDDFLTLRDAVCYAINAAEDVGPVNALEGYSTEELLAELKRRGV